MDDTIAYLGLLEDDAIALDASAIELAALDHPDVPVAPYLEVLKSVSERLGIVGKAATTATDRATVLAQVIAGEYGFTGDRDTYDDSDNADLIRVIDRRRGLPVSLAILYVAAARRLGWNADALNTPGHVLVRIGSETEPVLVDPFNDGVTVGPQQLSTLLAQMLGPTAVPTAEHLIPMSNRSVLVRLLINQATRALSSGKGERALAVYRRMTTIAPSNTHAWWERARLELVRGDVGDARASLSAMLEVTREPDLRAHIFAALDMIARPGA